tara:strand:+ start:13702 stop:14076 length:375 start_codon:yes stop_codon:yes gene_type:complete
MNRQPIIEYIQHWVDTVCKHNARDIVNLYAPDGILLGTVAENIKDGQTEIMEYFDMFVTKKPCGVIDTYYVQEYGDIAIVDGTYTFELNDDYGSRDSVPARYTFVLRKVNGEWKIATHHSSVNP